MISKSRSDERQEIQIAFVHGLYCTERKWEIFSQGRFLNRLEKTDMILYIAYWILVDDIG